MTAANSRTDLSRLVVGHRQAIAILERALDGDRLSHAYLFSGPSRVGKTTLARTFAQALVCAASTRPCGQCRSCRLISRDAYPDYRLIHVGGSEADPSEGERARSRNLKVEQVRSLQRDASLSPYEGRWKTYVIAGAEALTAEAANSLLKTLEEPPPHVVLLLTTEDPEALPSTIVSRCQQVRLAAVSASDLESALTERWGAPVDQARLLAGLAGGRVGWALEAFGNPRVLQERSERLADLRSLAQSNRAERFAYAEKLAQEYPRDPERVFRLLDLWSGWWRDVLLARVGCEDLVGNRDRLDDLRRPAQVLSVEQIRRTLISLEQAASQLSSNVNPRLALEVLLLDLPAA